MKHLEKSYDRENAVSRFENVKELIRLVKEYDAEFDIRPQEDAGGGEVGGEAAAAAIDSEAAGASAFTSSSHSRLASFITEVVRRNFCFGNCILRYPSLFPS